MTKYIKTEEHCRNISLACKGRKAWNKGIPLPEKQRLKIIASQKGKHWSPSTELKKGNKLRWKGGKTIIGGYLHIYTPQHPYATNKKYVSAHRLAMEKHLGRYLLPTERIHHLNGNKLDNRIKNLKHFISESEHQKYHQQVKRLQIRHGAIPGAALKII